MIRSSLQSILNAMVAVFAVTVICSFAFAETTEQEWKTIITADSPGRNPFYGQRQLTAEEVAQLPPAPEKDIPITFNLKQAGFVTIVIEDAQGKRVRNLVQDTWFEAGTSTIMWDGYDLGMPFYGGPGKGYRYDIKRRLVQPGTYTVRGIVHQGIKKRLMSKVQGPGNPPWMTTDNTGGWLGDHTPQSDCLSLPNGSPWGKEPQVMIACHTAEGGHGIIFVNKAGKKLYGLKFGWGGGRALAKDAGPHPDAAVLAYSMKPQGKNIEIYAVLNDGETTRAFSEEGKLGSMSESSAGLAVHNGVAVLSRPSFNELWFVDVHSNRKSRHISTEKIESPNGLLADSQGRLLIVTGKTIKLYNVDWQNGKLGESITLIDANLQDPRRMAKDAEGNLYVSDWGTSHQVKVFGPNGKLLRTIGKPGGQQFGAYDEEGMCNPNGIAVDAYGQLWVAENTYAPKRTSLWNAASGKFIRAFYGPPKYSAGGTLDSGNKNLFYYTGASGASKLGIEFEINWKTGESKAKSIYCLAEKIDRPGILAGCRAPERPIYLDGHKFIVSIGGVESDDGNLVLWEWQEDKRIVKPLAALGQAYLCSVFKKDGPLRDLLPKKYNRKNTMFTWSDLNRDGKVQRDEVTIIERACGGACRIRRDGVAVKNCGLRIPAPTLNADGVPIWNLKEFADIGSPRRGYLVDCILTPDDYFISDGGPIEGWKNGERIWEYQAQYPIRNKGPIPQYPGHLIAISRIIGPAVQPIQGQAGTVWGINGDLGNIYLFTSDGLFITDVGGDQRCTPTLDGPYKPGMIVGKVTFKGEHWWTTITQMHDTGDIYMQAGKASSLLFRLEGWEFVQRRTFGTITITQQERAGKPETYIKAAEWRIPKVAAVPIQDGAPHVDGDLSDWKDADWMMISGDRNITGAVAVSDGNLYAAYKMPDPAWLENSISDGWQYAFASGGGVDLHIRTQPDAKELKFAGHFYENPQLAPGDVRLFVTCRKNGKPLAIRLEQVRGSSVNLPQAREMLYTSPVKEVHFDSVADVSEDVQFAQKGGTVEIAVPISLLGIDVNDGVQTKADLGVLIGGGAETQARLYWGRGAGGMVSDVPTEASLAPRFWGTWKFEKAN